MNINNEFIGILKCTINWLNQFFDLATSGNPFGNSLRQREWHVEHVKVFECAVAVLSDDVLIHSVEFDRACAASIADGLVIVEPCPAWIEVETVDIVVHSFVSYPDRMRSAITN